MLNLFIDTKDLINLSVNLRVIFLKDILHIATLIQEVAIRIDKEFKVSTVILKDENKFEIAKKSKFFCFIEITKI